jgi:hypothetical protein
MAQMLVPAAKMIVWVFNAFWLWLLLLVLLKRLGLPFAAVGAAALSWVGAGLSLPWVLPAVLRWSSLPLAVARWLAATI